MPGLAHQVEEWLLREALGQPSVRDVFETLCLRLAGIGIPIARARLNWPTLHPLFRAEMVRWDRGTGPAAVEYFHHQDQNSEAWQQSPLAFMLEAGIPILRRRLSGPGKVVDFPLLNDLADRGLTDYIAFKTAFDEAELVAESRMAGIFVIWGTDRDSGFTDEDIDVLQQIQQTFALVCKSIIQAQITGNIVETYLGRKAGRSVMNGKIRLGDGTTTRALVWYSDMRDSTRLTARLASDDFLDLLNAYFECAARPAIEAGGEVLAFIGDAVLVIFPVSEETDLGALAEKVVGAARRSFEMRKDTNERHRAAGKAEIAFGIGLHLGEVVFGNIGVPERLAFTVIGSTVTEVERIEKLTKRVGPNILATAEVARLLPAAWQTIGVHSLAGVEDPMELFTTLGCGEDAIAAAE